MRTLGVRLARAPHREVQGGASGIFQQKNIRVLKTAYFTRFVIQSKLFLFSRTPRMTIQERVQSSQSILILVAPNAQEPEIRLAFSLLALLQKLNKQARVDYQKPPAPNQSSAIPTGKTFLVTLRGVAPWISKVHYEKDERDLKLYFSIQKGEISPQDISFQIQNQDQTDLVITTPGAIADSEAIPAQQTRDVLLQTLSQHTDPSARLLALAISKLEYSISYDLYAALLTPQDFQVSNSNAKTALRVMENLKKAFGDQTSYLLTYQTNPLSQHSGLLWSANNALILKIKHIQQGTQKGNWLLFQTAFPIYEQLRSSLLLS